MCAPWKYVIGDSIHKRSATVTHACFESTVSKSSLIAQIKSKLKQKVIDLTSSDPRTSFSLTSREAARMKFNIYLFSAQIWIKDSPNHLLDSIGRERLERVKSGYLFRLLHSFIQCIRRIGHWICQSTHIIIEYQKCMKRCVEHNEIGSESGKREKAKINKETNHFAWYTGCRRKHGVETLPSQFG